MWMPSRFLVPSILCFFFFFAQSENKHTAQAASDLFDSVVKPNTAVATGRIVGGQDAPVDRYPWYTFVQVARQTGNGEQVFSCGGTLVYPDIVLTAAHCFEGTVVRVLLAVNATSIANTQNAIYRNYAERRDHPNFVLQTFANDVSLVRLDTPVTTVPPVRLNNVREIPADGGGVRVMGFGFLEEDGGVLPQVKQVVDLNVVPFDTCSASIFNVVPITDDENICAAAPGRDSCQGDSGGPMIVPSTSEDNLEDVLVGLVSFGIGCARPNIPGVYARVSQHIDFIRQNVCSMTRVAGECTVLTNDTPRQTGTPPVSPPTTSLTQTQQPTPPLTGGLVPTIPPGVQPTPTTSSPTFPTDAKLSRNVRISDKGTAIATSTGGGPLRLELFNGPGVTLGLPQGIASFDEISISNEGYLFALSVHDQPSLCSFEINGSLLKPLSCLGGPISVSPYTGMSAYGGACVISGGSGGMSVFDYSTRSGRLNQRARCLNCPIQGADELVDIELFTPRQAAVSTKFGSEDYGTMIVNVETMERVRDFRISDSTGLQNVLPATNFPLVNAFYNAPTGRRLMYTANGQLTVQDPLRGDSTQILPPPLENFEAVALDVGQGTNSLVVGGLVGADSYIVVYHLFDNPQNPPVWVESRVSGRIVSVATNAGKIAYVTREVEAIQFMLETASPSVSPTILDSSSPSILPSQIPTVGPSMAPSSVPSFEPSDTVTSTGVRLVLSSAVGTVTLIVLVLT